MSLLGTNITLNEQSELLDFMVIQPSWNFFSLFMFQKGSLCRQSFTTKAILDGYRIPGKKWAT